MVGEIKAAGITILEQKRDDDEGIWEVTVEGDEKAITKP
jgi:hypothetical protein